MKNNMKNTFDELIKQAISTDLNTPDATPVPTDEELINLGYTLPPEDMYDRIIRKCRPTRRRNLKRLLIIAAVIAALLCGAMSVQAVRSYFYNMIYRVTDSSFSLRGSTASEPKSESDSEAIYKSVKEHFTQPVPVPDYIPKGYSLNKVKYLSKSRVRIIYGNESSDKIDFELLKLSPDTSNSMALDAADTQAFTETINGYEVMFAQYTRPGTDIQYVKALWDNDDFMFEITATVDINEVRKIIKGVK